MVSVTDAEAPHGRDGHRAVHLAAHQVEPEPRLCLSLEAAIHVDLRVGGADEEDADGGHDGREDAHRDDQLHQAVTALLAQKPDEQTPQFDLASTSARVRRATCSLWAPTPQSRWTRSSTAIRVRSAWAPFAQPKRAPVTIQLCW